MKQTCTLRRCMRRALGVFLTLNLLILLAYAVYKQNDISTQRIAAENNEAILIEAEKKIIQVKLDHLADDLRYISHETCLVDYVSGEGQLEEVIYNWILFSQSKDVYDQIRYIDTEGNERIRINNNNGSPAAVDEALLQNKGDRYYFVESDKLKQNEIYFSPLDLNIENGLIEQPLKPMIRASIGVYDLQGKKQGYLILNYLADEILQKVEQFTYHSMGENMLLNEEGYYLLSKTHACWGFMYSDSLLERFDEAFPGVWQQMIGGEQGNVYTSDGLFAYSVIRPYERLTENRANDEAWVLVSYISPDASIVYTDRPMLVMILHAYLHEDLVVGLSALLISALLAVLLVIRERNRSKINFLATYDLLTHTYNRNAGLNKINADFEKEKKSGSDYTICFVDINGLKHVNDTYGHKLGDALIVESVQILKKFYREEDIIRLGGDEFLIGAAYDTETLDRRWQQVLLEMQSINKAERYPFKISISHGVAAYKGDQLVDLDALISLADSRMYEEKKAHYEANGKR